MSHPVAGRSGYKGCTAISYVYLDLFGYARLHLIGKRLHVADSTLGSGPIQYPKETNPWLIALLKV